MAILFTAVINNNIKMQTVNKNSARIVLYMHQLTSKHIKQHLFKTNKKALNTHEAFLPALTNASVISPKTSISAGNAAPCRSAQMTPTIIKNTSNLSANRNYDNKQQIQFFPSGPETPATQVSSTTINSDMNARYKLPLTEQ